MYLLNNGTWEREKVLFFLCTALHVSSIFQDGGKKAWAVPISCQVTVLCASGQNLWFVCSLQFFFACQLYLMMYRIGCIMALVLRYVLHREKLSCCSPTCYCSKRYSKMILETKDQSRSQSPHAFWSASRHRALE